LIFRNGRVPEVPESGEFPPDVLNEGTSAVIRVLVFPSARQGGALGCENTLPCPCHPADV